VQNLIQAAREKHVVEVAYADVSLDFAAKISSAFPGFECRTQAGGVVRVAADEPSGSDLWSASWKNRGSRRT
jgi:hypothetical protein